MFKKEYYSLAEAASALTCAENDLLQFAAYGQVELCILMPKNDVLPIIRDATGALLPFAGNDISAIYCGPCALYPLQWRSFNANRECRTYSIKKIYSTYPRIKEIQSSPGFQDWIISPKGEHEGQVKITDCQIVLMADELERLSVKGSKTVTTLFNKYLCERDFGSAIFHVKTFQKWATDRGFHLRTTPSLDDYEFAQVEALLCAIEVGAAPQSPEDARAIIDSKPELIGHVVAERFPEPDQTHVWLVGADAHLQWRKLIEQAIVNGELQLLDGASYLPVSNQPTEPIKHIETDVERHQRIVSHVNKAFNSGNTKESAYRELAAIEKCSVDNIKRIYKR